MIAIVASLALASPLRTEARLGVGDRMPKIDVLEVDARTTRLPRHPSRPVVLVFGSFT